MVLVDSSISTLSLFAVLFTPSVFFLGEVVEELVLLVLPLFPAIAQVMP